MWRSSKVHVAEELEIPAKEEYVSWLTLNLKHDVIKRNSQSSETSNVLSDQFVSHLDATKLFNFLLKFWQACCHPQVGSSGLRSLNQSSMTMGEILLALVGETKIEGEGALRK